MKKTISVVMALVLVLGLMAGCAGGSGSYFPCPLIAACGAISKRGKYLKYNYILTIFINNNFAFSV